jgi:hypothetical protein|tara:strand:+ start:204 stop:587 length:384 start_codon:yes stop_codon:yes gene_type:complete
MSTIKAANLQNTGSGAPAFKNSSGTEIGQLCKAWGKLNGTGTAALDDSFNVSSITDNGTGDYTFTFTNAMSNANYCAVGTSEYISGGGDIFQIVTVTNATTSAVRVHNQQLNNISLDGIVSIAIFGD